VVDEECACCCGILLGVEGAAEGGQELGDAGVEGADIADGTADECCSVRWESGEREGAFGMLEEGAGGVY